jgi:hypothetical protein
MHLYLDRFAPLERAGVERAEAMLVEAGIADRPHQIEVSFDKKRTTARVEITMVAETFLPVDVWGENPIRVEAEAHLYGTQKLCVLALDGKSKHATSMEGGARLTAPDCAVQSNSRHPKGLAAKKLSLLVSAYTCTTGGYDGLGAAYIPIPTTDCPALSDPLEMRVAPPVGGCDYVDIEIKGGTRTIQPGHYCGGLKIEKNAQVTVDPGLYVISGGKLEIKDEAIFRGAGVGFYFADKDATFDFKDEAAVELSAAEDGPLAGLLFFEAPSAKTGRDFKISSDSVSQLIGTIYLPRGNLKASATEPGEIPVPGAPLEIIGDASTYTIIVANKIELDGVNLVINADYATSAIPVPYGLGSTSANLELTR